MVVDEDDQPDRTPIDHLVEAFVYAPLGLALEARTLVPRFVDRGRNQVELARVVGKFALRKGREDLESAVRERQQRVERLLRDLGVTDSPAPAPDDGRSGAGGDGSPRRSSVARPARPDPGIDAATLAIPGYDSLAASQVIPRLEGLDAAELEEIRRYEEAARGRRTILNKIAQLQSA